MISGVAARLEISLNSPSFYMMCQDADSATKAYRLQVVSATLLCPVKTLQSALAIDLEKRLLETPITYR